MKKNSFILAFFAFIACLVMVTGCKFNAGNSDSDIKAKTNSDGTVTLKLNAYNEYLGRTIAPDNPSLYFNVIGCTVAYTAATAPSTQFEGYVNIDSTTNGYDIATDPVYATEANKYTGLSFTIKAKTLWYFTCYATKSAPATIFSSYATTNGKTVAELTTADKVEALRLSSVVRGTLKFYVDQDSDLNPVFYTDSDKTTSLSSLTIPVGTANDEYATGTFYIPIVVPARADDSLPYTVNEIDIYVKGIPTNGASSVEATAAFKVTESTTAAVSNLVEGKIAPGTYSVTIRFIDNRETTETDDDIDYAEYREKLTVWADMTSTILSSGDHDSVTASTVSKGFTFAGSTATDIESSDYTNPSETLTLGFAPTQTELNNWQRRVFYVIGDGNHIKNTDTTTEETGSIFKPCKTISKAFSLVKAQAESTKYKDYTIVLDGDPSLAEGESSISLDYADPKGFIADSNEVAFNLTLSPLTSAAVSLSHDVSIVESCSVSATPAKYTVIFDNVGTDSSASLTLGTENFVLLSGSVLNGKTYLNNEAASGTTCTSESGIINIKTDSAGKALDIYPEKDQSRWSYGKEILRYSTWDKDTDSTYLEASGFTAADFVINEDTLKDDDSNTVFKMEMDDKVGSDTRGIQIIKYTTSSAGVNYANNKLNASDTISTKSLSKASLQAGTNNTITATITVESNDTTNYPANKVLTTAVKSSSSATSNDTYALVLDGITVTDKSGSSEITSENVTISSLTAQSTQNAVGKTLYDATITFDSSIGYAVESNYTFVLTINYTVTTNTIEADNTTTVVSMPYSSTYEITLAD